MKVQEIRKVRILVEKPRLFGFSFFRYEKEYMKGICYDILDS